MSEMKEKTEKLSTPPRKGKVDFSPRTNQHGPRKSYRVSAVFFHPISTINLVFLFSRKNSSNSHVHFNFSLGRRRS